MWMRKLLGVAVLLCGCTPTNADGPPSTSAIQQGTTPLPCDVAQVLHDKCWSCHGTTLDYTAPMHLTSWEGTQAQSGEVPGTPIYQRMSQRLHDSANPMPPRTWPTRPTADEIAIIDRWVAAGAPAGDGTSQACQPALPGAGGGSGVGSGGGGNFGGSGDLGGSGNAGGATQQGAGGAVTLPPLPDGGVLTPPTEDVPVKPDPSECTMIPIHARADSSGAPFNVPSGEQYYCFSFHLPFNGATQGLSFAPHEDSHTVIHHWLLYKMVTPQIDGLVLPCVGFHADGALLAGWTPGAGEWDLPKDVGMNLGGGDFILEVHYNNQGSPVADTSGVDVCSTTTLRPKTAGIFWLGTPSIDIPPLSADTEIPSTCKPNLTQDFHILKAWPHMHKLGRHMHAEVHHPDGSMNQLFDVPFDFAAQTQYDTPFILKQGDSITTTCGYQNTTASNVSFGESTTQEMCFNFTVGYPDNTDFPGGNGPTACN